MLKRVLSEQFLPTSAFSNVGKVGLVKKTISQAVRRPALRVLHLLPHLGGGVGQVLGNIAAVSRDRSIFDNEFILLDEVGEESRRNIETYGLNVFPQSQLAERVERADIVQIDWWNHPTLARFLGSISISPSRVLVYSHISGFYYPNIVTRAIVDYSDLFVTSTAYAYRNLPILSQLRQEGGGGKLATVHSCSGLGRVSDVLKKPHQGFRVGYIGTLDFSKIHPDFVAMSADVTSEGVCFPVYGQGGDKLTIQAQVLGLGAEDRFHFAGYVNDIVPVFSSIDVLGYPLNSCHYGTGEQVLIESMGAGVPAVVMNNGPEMEIVRDGYNGLVASSSREYTQCLERLAVDPALVLRLGSNAKEFAQNVFSIQKILDQFASLYSNLMAQPKLPRRVLGRAFPGAQEGVSCFLNSLGDCAELYMRSAFYCDAQDGDSIERQIAQENVKFATDAKGSIFQYRKYFPEDATLTYWCGLVMREKGELEKAEEYFKNAEALGFVRRRAR